MTVAEPLAGNVPLTGPPMEMKQPPRSADALPSCKMLQGSKRLSAVSIRARRDQRRVGIKLPTTVTGGLHTTRSSLLGVRLSRQMEMRGIERENGCQRHMKINCHYIERIYKIGGKILGSLNSWVGSLVGFFSSIPCCQRRVRGTVTCAPTPPGLSGENVRCYRCLG